MSSASARSSAAPVGVHASVEAGPACAGHPAQQLDDGGRRHRQRAVRDATRPVPTATGDTTSRSSASCSEPGAHPDHVGDRVQRPDLVERDLAPAGCRAPHPRRRPGARTPPPPGPAPAGSTTRPRAAPRRRATSGARSTRACDVAAQSRRTRPRRTAATDSSTLGRDRVDRLLQHRRRDPGPQRARRAACRRTRRRTRPPSRSRAVSRSPPGAPVPTGVPPASPAGRSARRPRRRRTRCRC